MAAVVNCACPARNRQPDGSHSDAARRAADNVNIHIAAKGDEARRRWVAIALADGASDGVLYDTKRDAVRHQHHNEQLYAFVCIPPAGSMTVCEAESFLRFNRMAYDAGFRLTDPDDVHGGKELIRPLTIQDFAAKSMALLRAAKTRR